MATSINPASVQANLPHGRAIEMNHHPFTRVERNRVRVRDARKPMTKFRTYERRARVRRVHVKPHVFRVA